MKNKRRIFAWMLCLVLLGAASPMRVNAEDEQQSEGIVLYEEGGKPEYTEAEAESEVYSETETPIETEEAEEEPEATEEPEVVEEPEATEEPEDTATPEPTATVEPTATPEPDTLQGWAESLAERVFFPIDSGISTLISVTCEQVDGETAPMVTVNVEFPDGAKNDSRVSAFLSRASKMNRYMSETAKEGKIEYGSLLVIGWTTYIDKYGNESDGHAVDIRVKASEAAKVNWENFSSDMLPGIAVSFGINPIIRDGLSLEYYSKIRY